MFKHLLKAIFLCFFIYTNSIFSQNTSVTPPKKGNAQVIGDVVLTALPTFTFATTLFKKDKKGTWQFTKSILLTGAVTYVLKLGINKQRPDMSNVNSFPSGHTSVTFHSAGFIHRRYGFKSSIPAYLLAGFTASSRIDSNKHDILDVLAGAAIGLGSNLIFTTEYQKEHLEITFSRDNNDFLIGLTYKI